MKMGMVWKATSTAPLNGIAVEAVGAVKAAVAARCGGVVPPNEFLREIEPADHPAHALVEWDDRIAGHQYRLSQAAGVIQVVVVVYEPDEHPAVDIGGIVATIVDAQGAEERHRGYMPVYEVLSNEDYTHQAERRILRQIVGDLKNHRDLPLAQRLLEAVMPVAEAWEDAHSK